MTPIPYKAKFQFHNGSIKSDIDTEAEVVTYLFQFHNGSIKRDLVNDRMDDPATVSISQWFD